MFIPTFTSEGEACGFLVFQIWCVIGFLSHMFSGDDPFEPPLWKSIFYMALGPLNIIRIMVKKAISAISNKAISKNKECTYTKWHTYYKKEDETTFVVHKTRHKCPNWWPKNMKKNDAGFPDYIELRSKLDLDHNEKLRKYIDYMYETYNKLYDVTYGMLPEEIKFLKDLRYTLMELYKDELKNCKGITEINNNTLALFMAETNYKAAMQNIFNAYMKNCADYFNQSIKGLFQEK